MSNALIEKSVWGKMSYSSSPSTIQSAMKYNSLVLLLISILIFSCTQKNPAPPERVVNLDSLKDVLKQTDLAFSNLSKEKGRNVSFLEYMDEHVTMIRSNSMPLVGKDTMQKIYATRPDTAYTLTWAPLFADVAASGDLGYTYGTWQLEMKTGEKGEGTYCTIWKPSPDGHWRMVLDIGNEGLKAEEKK